MTTDDIPIMRVPISLPCQAKVHAGTSDTSGPAEERTEYCAVDAWWMIGRGMVCDLHLRGVLGDHYDEILDLPEDFEYNPRELVPWDEMHRYDQAQAAPEWDKT